MKSRTVLLILLVTLGLAACGNKGPLVLPDRVDDAAFDDEVDEAVEDVDETIDPAAGDAPRDDGEH